MATVYLSAFKCTECNMFSYSIATSPRGQTATCRKCGKPLNTRCVAGENTYLPNGSKPFGSLESANKQLEEILIAEGCSAGEIEHVFGISNVDDDNSLMSRNLYLIRFCEKCDSYFLCPSDAKLCHNGHLIDVSVPATAQFTKQIDAIRKCASLNKTHASKKETPSNDPHEEVSMGITFMGRYYSQDEVIGFHDRVYRLWNTAKLFATNSEGELNFTRDYLAYLNGFKDGTEYKRIYKSRRQILSELSNISNPDERFYFYLHQNNLLGDNPPLCWKVGNKCVCYESVDSFITCFLTRDIYNLNRSQMQVMVNNQTKRFFFFADESDTDCDGELNELRFATLILEHTPEKKLLYKTLNYNSLDTFIRHLNRYDGKINERYDFIRALVQHRFDDSVSRLIISIFNCQGYDLVEPSISDLDNIGLTDGDQNYLPEWNDRAILLPYLELCAYHSRANEGQLNVFQLDFGSSCDELISNARDVISEAYRNQTSRTSMRKFAVLRLGFLSGIIESIDGVSMEISSDQNIIGVLKKFFDEQANGKDSTEGSFDNLLSQAYIRTLSASERHLAVFAYDGMTQTLRDHVISKSDSFEELLRLWNSVETRKFVEYVLSGNETMGGSPKEQLTRSIDDVYKQCSDIEKKLNKKLEEINAQYIRTIREVAPDVSSDEEDTSQRTSVRSSVSSQKPTSPPRQPIVNETNNDDSDW